eukprot:5400667-Pleurochrysis_carterae.AAC.2
MAETNQRFGSQCFRRMYRNRRLHADSDGSVTRRRSAQIDANTRLRASGEQEEGRQGRPGAFKPEKNSSNLPSAYHSDVIRSSRCLSE